MGKADWIPELYLRYEKERTQPAIDLVARIDLKNPKTIIDIGCGPGNSTKVIFEKYPNARILGIDKSPSMIEKAKQENTEIEWRVMDAGEEEFKEKYDIVFSNATIQWIPNHDKLLKKLYNILNDAGVLAIQIPLFWDMPLGKSINETASQEKWKEITSGVRDLFTIKDFKYYHNILSDNFNILNIWETFYIHEMGSHESILEMIRSTGLKPYLERIQNKDGQNEFENIVLKTIERDYPKQQNGKVLFPFKRLFFWLINKR